MGGDYFLSTMVAVMSIKKKLKLKLFKKIKTIVGINLNFYEAILSFLLN